MNAIPAASVSKEDLERIRMADPNAAAEMERIGQLLLRGKESEDDLLRLVELLIKSGELTKAELILLANSTNGDRLHALHRELFKAAEDNYKASLKIFSDQLGVVLSFVRSPRIYSEIYKCESINCNSELSYYVQFTYMPESGIVADLYQEDQGNPGNISTAFRYKGSLWVKDDILPRRGRRS